VNNQSVDEEVYTLKNQIPDYTISSFLGLSISVVTTIVLLTMASIQIADIRIGDLSAGEFRIQGDPSLLYMSIFVIAATILLVVQHHFQVKTEEEEVNF